MQQSKVFHKHLANFFLGETSLFVLTPAATKPQNLPRPKHIMPLSSTDGTVLFSLHLLSDSSAIVSASISASSIFCSISRRSSWPRMAVTLMRCISASASAAFWASSFASSSAIWAFSASRSAVCSERNWRGAAGGRKRDKKTFRWLQEKKMTKGGQLGVQKKEKKTAKRVEHELCIVNYNNIHKYCVSFTIFSLIKNVS